MALPLPSCLTLKKLLYLSLLQFPHLGNGVDTVFTYVIVGGLNEAVCAKA